MELFSLGQINVSDFLKEGEEPRSGLHELKLVMDPDGAVHLSEYVPYDLMFGKYWYRSGLNESMKKGLKNIVDSINGVVKKKGVWLDIACNDGTLLSFVEGYKTIGIDPVEESFVKESSKIADIIVQDYFSKDAYFRNIDKKADVITTIAMFYDLVDREPFLKDVYDVMEDNGLWVLQMSYTPLMIKQVAFDNICHEHYYYYSLSNIQSLLSRNGFEILDCQLNDINGGSFRIYCMKDKGDVNFFASNPYRDVCEIRMQSILAYERKIGINSPQIWREFETKIRTLKKEVVNFIKQEKAKGKVIYGYGASTKGNTLLQYFGLDNSLITAIADVSPYKQGLKTVITNIPIISEEQMRKDNPDYLLILPWHFISEFEKRESDYLLGGGKFIVPCPELKIVKKSESQIREYVYTHTMQETGQEIEDYMNKRI